MICKIEEMAEGRIKQTEAVRGSGKHFDPRPFVLVFRRLFPSREVPEFTIENYPYRDIKNTLRIRNGVFHVRVSDMLAGAPDSVVKALYEILLCRTFRIKEDSRTAVAYNSYLASEEFRDRCSTIADTGCHSERRKTGKRRKSTELRRRFDLINRDYFQGELEPLDLFWIDRRSTKILGQYVAHRDEILINSKLDHPLVPQSVIDFVLYHEMLHTVIQPRISKTGRKLVHHRSFRREERRFRNFKFANDFIRENF